MAHSLSAEKRHRQSLRRHERNKARRSAARTAVRRARELIASGAQEEAKAAVREAGSILDRTARKRVLHANTAARSKSRLMRRLKAMEGAPKETSSTPKRRTRASGSTTKTSARKTSGRTTRAKKS